MKQSLISRFKRLTMNAVRFVAGWWPLAIIVLLVVSATLYLTFVPIDGTGASLKWASELGSWMSGIGAVLLQSITLISILWFSSLQLREQRKQATMNNFFELLKRYDDAVSRLSHLAEGARSPHRGRDAFDILIGEFESISRKTNGDIVECGNGLWRNEEKYGEWLRSIQMIVSFIREEAKDDEKRYVKIFRSYLSRYEAQALKALYATKQDGSGTGAFLRKHDAFKYAFSRVHNPDRIWGIVETKLQELVEDEEDE